MLLQASHTEAGIRPMACSLPKIAPHKQKPTADSSSAATVIRPTNTQDSVGAPTEYATTAATDRVAPMACANRLGGPGTNFGGPIRGAITFVASCPNGENLGPEATLARKPSANAHSSHGVWNTSVAVQSTTTIAATERAAYSFTGLGNVSSFEAAMLIRLPCSTARLVDAVTRPAGAPQHTPTRVPTSPAHQMFRDRPTRFPGQLARPAVPHEEADN